MYIINGIAYAGESKPKLFVIGVRPLEDWKLWLRFNTGEAKIYDVKQLFKYSVYAPLKDVNTFKSVYIDYGCVVWNDGDIDIATEELYESSIPATDKQTA